MNDQHHSLSETRALLGEISDLKGAAAVLEWDQETFMPSGGSDARAQQVATLRRLAHERFTSAQAGDLLREAQLRAEADEDRRFYATLLRDYGRLERVPGALVAEKAEAVGKAKEAWKLARQSDDFGAFAPHLKRITEINIRWAEAVGYASQRYDALLDEFEPEMKTETVSSVFANLRSRLVPIVRAIAENPQPDDSVLRKPYSRDDQWDFGIEVIKDFGYDFNCGRQDFSAHPFTTTFDISDVRITTRIQENFLPTGLFGTLHECGHALYEQGINPNLARTPLAEGTSLGMHESQSRLWENQVGRSKSFWKYYYPRLQHLFPHQLHECSLNQFYRAINRVEPSLIRVEADEVTYNLHIMLRFEIEVALINQTVEVDDLPDMWNQAMENYLGVVPPDHGSGVLQDIHWSLGAMGYFPTYALGTLMSAQIFEAAQKSLGNLSEAFERGEFLPLRKWLQDTIHQHGRLHSAEEILHDVTGTGLSAEPWLEYIRAKYGELYSL